MSDLTVQTFPEIAAAAAALRGDPRARYVAGGTLVMRDLNEGDTRHSVLVRVTDPGLSQIQPRGDRIEIGAGVTMAAVLASRDLGFLAPAARAVGGPAVRVMATVGGNLFAAHPYGDVGAALLALDGQVSLAGGGAPLSLAEFYARRDQMAGQLVASVSIARPSAEDFRFKKVSRVKPKAVSVMSIAAWLPRSGGRITGARIAYGAMGPSPLRAAAVERALEGRSLDQASIAPALAAATEGLAPPDDALASAWYRREVAPVHLRRLLLGEDP